MELKDVAFTEHAEKLFERGVKSVDYLLVEGPRTWEIHWLNVGRALAEARQQIMRYLDTQNPKSQKYRDLMGQFLRARGFDRIDGSDRSWLQKCMDHEIEIADWRSLMSDAQKLALNHPKRVWEAWQRTLRVETSGEKRPTLKDEVVRLQAELDEARAALSTYMAAERPVVAPDAEKMAVIDDLGRKELERRANEWWVKYEEAVAQRSMMAEKLLEVERERNQLESDLDELTRIVEADRDPEALVYLFQELAEDGTVIGDYWDDPKWSGFLLFQTREGATNHAMERMEDERDDIKNFRILECRQKEFDLTRCYPLDADGGEVWFSDNYYHAPGPADPDDEEANRKFRT